MDAFGQELYDTHRGLVADEYREVGERDDGYIQVYEHPRWYFTPFDEWYPHLQKAMEYISGRTLDVGCGAGRVTIPLQQNWMLSESTARLWPSGYARSGGLTTPGFFPFPRLA